MRWLAVCAIAVSAGVAALAQPIFTADDRDETMQGVGRQFALINQMITASDFETAKVRVTRAREQLSPTISFWRKNQRADAVRMLKHVTGKLDDLDAALSEITIDPATVLAAASEVGSACNACHNVYREKDPESEAFSLRPGSLN